MKLAVGSTVLVAAVLGAISPAWPASEARTVEQVITDVAKAYMAFPKTRDHQSVLRHFAPDCSIFDDAELRSLQDLERTLVDLEQDLDRIPIEITEQIADITVHLNGSLGWATYRDKVTLARPDATAEDVVLCTAIFHETPAGWVYQHEHCSSTILEKSSESDELARLTLMLERTIMK